MTRAARILLLLVLMAVLLPSLVSACPTCKDAKSDTDYPGGSASLPKGFYYSILLMVSAPFVVVGSVALRIYLARRRHLQLPAMTTTVEQAAGGFHPASPEART